MLRGRAIRKRAFRACVLLVILFIIANKFIKREVKPVANSDGSIPSVDCSKLSWNLDNPDYLSCVSALGLKSVQVITETYPFATNRLDVPLGRSPFDYCMFETRCFAFRYTSKFQTALPQSDGVIVHMPDLVRLPSRSSYHRRPEQLWFMFTMEPQRFSYCALNSTLEDLDDWFNSTQNIKTQSYNINDLKQLHKYEFYVMAYMRDSRDLKLPEESFEQKKSLAIWFVSRCQTPNGREKYVEELSKYIQIDIYGKCGTHKDPCRHVKGYYEQARCLNGLFNDYKFYIAFENCNCDGYITEKFFKFYREDLIFKVDIVPIAMGASLEEYEKSAPKQPSFIFAPSYPSPKALADYLLYLNFNQTAYLEYFEWKYELYDKLRRIPENYLLYSKSELFLKPQYFNPMCEFCLQLHNKTFMSEKRPALKISEEYNFIKDCYNKSVLEANPHFTFDNLKNRCFFASNDTDWS